MPLDYRRPMENEKTIGSVATVEESKDRTRLMSCRCQAGTHQLTKAPDLDDIFAGDYVVILLDGALPAGRDAFEGGGGLVRY